MSVVLNLFVALMLPGMIVRTRALLAGRKGAPFYQHISRLGALLCKAPVYSPATGFVFRLAPVVYLASTVAAMLLVPVGDFSAVLAFNGDIVLFHNDSNDIVNALPTVIQHYQGLGFTIIPVGQIVLDGDYTIDVQGKQHPVQTTQPTQEPQQT